jgi:hypothetical protein
VQKLSHGGAFSVPAAVLSARRLYAQPSILSAWNQNFSGTKPGWLALTGRAGNFRTGEIHRKYQLTSPASYFDNWRGFN